MAVIRSKSTKEGSSKLGKKGGGFRFGSGSIPAPATPESRTFKLILGLMIFYIGGLALLFLDIKPFLGEQASTKLPEVDSLIGMDHTEMQRRLGVGLGGGVGRVTMEEFNQILAGKGPGENGKIRFVPPAYAVAAKDKLVLVIAAPLGVKELGANSYFNASLLYAPVPEAPGTPPHPDGPRYELSKVLLADRSEVTGGHLRRFKNLMNMLMITWYEADSPDTGTSPQQAQVPPAIDPMEDMEVRIKNGVLTIRAGAPTP
jgi:hypothetical protein